MDSNPCSCVAVASVRASGAYSGTDLPAGKHPAPPDRCPAWGLRLGWGGASISLLVVVGLAAQTSAQPATLGGEFQINTYATGSQRFPDVSAGPGGEFVVVWDSNGSSDSDSSFYSIQGRRYASDGTTLGSDFQVNTYTTSFQGYPDVSVGPAGSFVVVWASSGSSYGDNSSSSIQGQIWSSDGIATFSQFQVNGYTISFQQSPGVSVGPGGVMVVWDSNGSSGSDSSFQSVQGKILFGTGDLQINTYTTNSQSFPSVSVGPGGEFVVVWESNGSIGDSSNTSIHGRRYAADGTALTDGFQVNTYTTSLQSRPSVSVGSGGEFVVVWQGSGSSGSDSSNRSVQGRLYASDGTALGSDFQVNTYTTSIQRYPGVSVGPGGEFVVVWESVGSNGGDSSGFSIQGRLYASDGTALGSDFQVNTYTTSYQRYPGVSVGPGGEFVVVWESNGSSGSDSSEYSIQGQRYAALPFFSDGFESGNTSRWSATVP